MRRVVISPFGGKIQIQAIQKELKPDKIFLVCHDQSCVLVDEFMDKYKNMDIGRIALRANLFEDIFEKLKEIKHAEKDAEIFVNCSCGDTFYDGLFLVASMSNQLKAFTIQNRKLVFFPYMKLAYYNLISDKKLSILKFLNSGDCCTSLEELSKKLNMSLPLVSYHVNGNLKSEGLKDMGLVELMRNKSRIDVRISPVGRLILFGHIEQEKIE